MFVKLKAGKIEGEYELGLQKHFDEKKIGLLIDCITSINRVLDDLSKNGPSDP